MCYVVGGEEAGALAVAPEMPESMVSPQQKKTTEWDDILSIPLIKPAPESEKLTQHLLPPSIVQSMQEYIDSYAKVDQIIHKWNSLYPAGTKTKLFSPETALMSCGPELDAVPDGVPAVTCSPAFVYAVPMTAETADGRRTSIDIFPVIMVRTTVKTGKAEDAMLVPLYRVRPVKENL